MIAYEELVGALASWRERQGLSASGGGDYLGPEVAFPVYRVAQPSAEAMGASAEVHDSYGEEFSEAAEEIAAEVGDEYLEGEALAVSEEYEVGADDAVEEVAVADEAAADVGEVDAAEISIGDEYEEEVAEVAADLPEDVGYEAELSEEPEDALSYDAEATEAGGIDVAQLAAQDGFEPDAEEPEVAVEAAPEEDDFHIAEGADFAPQEEPETVQGGDPSQYADEFAGLADEIAAEEAPAAADETQPVPEEQIELDADLDEAISQAPIDDSDSVAYDDPDAKPE